MQVQFLGQEDPLEKDMAVHSRISCQKSLVGYGPYDHTELDMTEATQQARTSLNIKFSCIYILEASPYIILYESGSVFLYEYSSSLLCVLIPGLLYPLVPPFSLTLVFCLFSRPQYL